MAVLWLILFVWRTNLTPEPEVLHFGLKVPYISYLWTIFTVRATDTLSVSIQKAHHGIALILRGLTVKIFLCEGRCRWWSSCCDPQSKEFHPQ